MVLFPLRPTPAVAKRSIAMKAVRNILTIVDPTATTHPAIAKSAQLARALQAKLELFVCDYRSGLDAPEAAGARTTLLEHRRSLLEELAAPPRKSGIDVSVDAVFDNPLHEGLLKKIAQVRPDLVVKDTHYHNLVRRTLITNTDWHLIRSCPSPLLLVKPTHWIGGMKVLAAVDPEHSADKPPLLDDSICEWSRTLSSAMKGEAHAVHMYFPGALLIASGAATGMPMPVVTAADQGLIEEERRARLKLVLEVTMPRGIPAENTRVAIGSAAELLNEEAERVRADIVVMGAVSRSRLQRLFVGNTAEQVLDHLPCDVLVVKPLDFATDLPF
jgi:universal stress protein E